MFRFVLAIAFLLLAPNIFAGDRFNGLQLVPRWDRDEALVVEVSNWTKVTVTLSRIEVRVPGSALPACSWKLEQSLVLEPTIKHVLVVAPVRAARGCLQSRPGLERARARDLRLAQRVGESSATSGEPLDVSATVELKGRQRQSGSRWLVQRTAR